MTCRITPPPAPQVVNGYFGIGFDSHYAHAVHNGDASWLRSGSVGRRPPAFSTALAFFDGIRSERLPTNLLQAQRDFFGAHTYERVDKPRGEFFHTHWTGTDGRVANSLSPGNKIAESVVLETSGGQPAFARSNKRQT